MSWAGCYALDLYCDRENEAHGYGEFPHQFTAETGGDCRKQAREAGWIVRSDGSCICPKCSGKKPTVTVREPCETISAFNVIEHRKS